jgi:hypothetical protein
LKRMKKLSNNQEKFVQVINFFCSLQICRYNSSILIKHFSIK